MENEFLSKVEKARAKTVQNLLKIYYYTYVFEDRENNPLLLDKAKDFQPRRSPKIPPGLRNIQRYLKCRSRSTAQGYLTAVDIIREVFVEKEARGVPIKAKDYRRLRQDLANVYGGIAKELRVANDRAKMQRIRALLDNAGALVGKSSGLFSPADCAKLFEDLKNNLV